MALSVLLTAILSGFVASGVWLLSGGTVLGAVGAYLLTGQLVSAAMFLQLLFGPREEG